MGGKGFPRYKKPYRANAYLLQDFLEKHESIADVDFHQIKTMTKLMSIAFIEHDYLNDNPVAPLKRIYDYYVDSIRQLDECKDQSINIFDLWTMKTHMHNYASKVALSLYKKTQDSSWLKEHAMIHAQTAFNMSYDLFLHRENNNDGNTENYYKYTGALFYMQSSQRTANSIKDQIAAINSRTP